MSKNYELKLNGLTATQQMISSCTGAIITAVFMTPFDVVKVRLQAQQRNLLSSRCFLYCNGLMDHLCTCAPSSTRSNNNGFSPPPWFNKPLPIKLNGTVDAFVKISQSEGFKSLWSGLPPTLIVAIPNTVVYLSCYEFILKSIRKKYYPKDQPLWAGGIAGGLSRFWSVTVFSPLELLRTKVQSKSISYKEVFETLNSELKVSGLASLWRGWTPTLLRDVPFSILYWMVYENMKQSAHQHHPSILFSLFAGSVAGAAAGIVTLPLDVVKTHQQIEMAKPTTTKASATKAPETIRSMLALIYRQQGVAGLFTGIVPRLVKVAPACAIMISSYEYAKSYFRQMNEKRILGGARF